jgi:hypothetical protein
MTRLLCLCLMWLVCANAGASTRQGDPVPDALAAPTWNQLDPQQQSDLRPFAERWDRMPAPRRLHILKRYERWQHVPPGRRHAMREGLATYQRMSPEQRWKIRRSMHAVHALPPAQQRVLRQQWRAMTPQQRSAWLDAGGPGIAPPPKP